MVLLSRYKLNGNNKNDVYNGYDAVISNDNVKSLWNKKLLNNTHINKINKNYVCVNNSDSLYMYKDNGDIQWKIDDDFSDIQQLLTYNDKTFVLKNKNDFTTITLLGNVEKFNFPRLIDEVKMNYKNINNNILLTTDYNGVYLKKLNLRLNQAINDDGVLEREKIDTIIKNGIKLVEGKDWVQKKKDIDDESNNDIIVEFNRGLLQTDRIKIALKTYLPFSIYTYKYKVAGFSIDFSKDVENIDSNYTISSVSKITKDSIATTPYNKSFAKNPPVIHILYTIDNSNVINELNIDIYNNDYILDVFNNCKIISINTDEDIELNTKNNINLTQGRYIFNIVKSKNNSIDLIIKQKIELNKNYDYIVDYDNKNVLFNNVQFISNDEVYITINKNVPLKLDNKLDIKQNIQLESNDKSDVKTITKIRKVFDYSTNTIPTDTVNISKYDFDYIFYTSDDYYKLNIDALGVDIFPYSIKYGTHRLKCIKNIQENKIEYYIDNNKVANLTYYPKYDITPPVSNLNIHKTEVDILYNNIDYVYDKKTKVVKLNRIITTDDILEFNYEKEEASYLNNNGIESNIHISSMDYIQNVSQLYKVYTIDNFGNKIDLVKGKDYIFSEDKLEIIFKKSITFSENIYLEVINNLYTDDFYITDINNSLYKFDCTLNLKWFNTTELNGLNDFFKYKNLKNKEYIFVNYTKDGYNSIIKIDDKTGATIFDSKLYDRIIAVNDEQNILYTNFSLDNGSNKLLNNASIINKLYNNSSFELKTDNDNDIIYDYKVINNCIVSLIAEHIGNFIYMYLYKNDLSGNLLYKEYIGRVKDLTNFNSIIYKNNRFYFGNKKGEVLVYKDNGVNFELEYKNKIFTKPIKFIIPISSDDIGNILFVSDTNVIFSIDSNLNSKFIYTSTQNITNAIGDNNSFDNTFYLVYDNSELLKVNPTLYYNKGIIADDCFEFNGGNSNIKIKNPFNDTENEMSVSLWYKPTTFDMSEKILLGTKLSDSWNSITYSYYDNKFYMLSSDNKLALGSLNINDIDWKYKDLNINSDYNYKDICWINSIERLVIRVENQNKYYISYNGNNWYIRNLPKFIKTYFYDNEYNIQSENVNLDTDFKLNKIVSIEDKHIVGFIGDNTDVMLYSNNIKAMDEAVLYKSVKLPIKSDWVDFAYGNDRFVIIDKNGNIYSTNYLTENQTIVSKWDSSNISINNLTSVCYDSNNKQFIAISSTTDSIIVSKDGIYWNRYNLPKPYNNVNRVFYNSYNNFIYILLDDCNTILSSDNGGLDWNIEEITEYNIDYSGIAYHDNVMVLSIDGSNLSIQNIDNQWYSNYTDTDSYFTLFTDSNRILSVMYNNIKYRTNFIVDSSKVNNWYNIIVTIKNSTMNVYINENPINTFKLNTNKIINKNKEFIIGDVLHNDILSNKYHLYGCVNDLRLYNHALSNKEITDIYNLCVIKVKTFNQADNLIISDNSEYVNPFIVENESIKPNLENISYSIPTGCIITNDNLYLTTNMDKYTISFWYNSINENDIDERYLINSFNEKDGGWSINNVNNGLYFVLYNGNKNINYTIDYDTYEDNIRLFNINDNTIKIPKYIYEFKVNTDPSLISIKYNGNIINIYKNNILLKNQVDYDIVDDLIILKNKNVIDYFDSIKIETKANIKTYMLLNSNIKNELNHYSIVYNKGNINVFINGVSNKVYNNIDIKSSYTKLILKDFNGDEIKDFRIYHSSLDSSNIEELYNQGNILDSIGNLYSTNIKEDSKIRNINIDKNGMVVRNIVNEYSDKTNNDIIFNDKKMNLYIKNELKEY